jgi:autophagy-related protein 11
MLLFTPLTHTSTQTIYVFNKNYLELDLDEVLSLLRAPPPLQPPVDGQPLWTVAHPRAHTEPETAVSTPPARPSQLATAYLRAAHQHLASAKHLLACLRRQHSALRLSASALDLRALQLADAADELAQAARRELARQAGLLAGLDADLALVARVRVHPEFLSPAARRALAQGAPPRTLGDYVSAAKMRTVADTCARAHADTQARYTRVQDAMARLAAGADEIRALAADAAALDEAELAVQRATDACDRMTDAAGLLESPAADAGQLLAELRQLDQALRDDLTFIVDTKVWRLAASPPHRADPPAQNTFTHRLLGALRQISALNEDVLHLPGALTALQASVRAKTSSTRSRRRSRRTRSPRCARRAPRSPRRSRRWTRSRARSTASRKSPVGRVPGVARPPLTPAQSCPRRSSRSRAGGAPPRTSRRSTSSRSSSSRRGAPRTSRSAATPTSSRCSARSLRGRTQSRLMPRPP